MERTVLWHLPPSHYSEKVRWALDHTGVAHVRRAITPPAHMPIARALSGGWTFPVLQLGGRGIGGSAAILAALEQRRPGLLPTRAPERARALALQRHFDDEVGPWTRGLAFHDLLGDPPALARFAATMLPAPVAGSAVARRLAADGAAAFVRARYRPGGAGYAERARAAILAGFDRLEAELDGRRHLVGDAFSVADLAAACMLSPVVLPPEGPDLPDPPAAFEAFRAPLRERPGYRWVLGTFARHR